MKLCIISMSGGLDSTTLARKALDEGYHIQPINFIYNQKNSIEKLALKRLFRNYFNNFENINPPIEINLEEIFANFSKIRDNFTIKNKTGMEYYTPSRNLIFTVIASVIGETIAFYKDIDEISIAIGVHKHETYSKDYWDISPEFIYRLQHLLDLNDCIKINVYAPYVKKNKNQIVKDVLKYNIPYNLTWTCYSPTSELFPYHPLKPKRIYSSCKKCEACVEREKAAKNIIKDINDYYIIE